MLKTVRVNAVVYLLYNSRIGGKSGEYPQNILKDASPTINHASPFDFCVLLVYASGVMSHTHLQVGGSESTVFTCFAVDDVNAIARNITLGEMPVSAPVPRVLSICREKEGRGEAKSFSGYLHSMLPCYCACTPREKIL